MLNLRASEKQNVPLRTAPLSPGGSKIQMLMTAHQVSKWYPECLGDTISAPVASGDVAEPRCPARTLAERGDRGVSSFILSSPKGRLKPKKSIK